MASGARRATWSPRPLQPSGAPVEANPGQPARILRDRIKWRLRDMLVSAGRTARPSRHEAATRGADGDCDAASNGTVTGTGRSGGRRPGPLQRFPEKYSLFETNGKVPYSSVLAFNVEDPADFDLMETVIFEDGYYEAPHIWPLRVDRDKRVMAEVVASLNQGGRVLELGCANGAVLEGLALRGIDFVGIDISQRALARASRTVRARARLGDILTADLCGGFDTVVGLDIFEHLNPNKLASYLGRLRELLADGGLVFANIPGFGMDEVFGEVFPRYLREWDAAAAAGRPFRQLHADHDGYPINGHLIWAESSWWVEQFANADLRRQVAIELALHKKYDEYMVVHSPARRSFYVFSAGECPDEVLIARRIAATPSFELMTLRRPKTLSMLWR